MTIFSKKSNCDLDFNPSNLKRKLVQSVVIYNITVILY